MDRLAEVPSHWGLLASASAGPAPRAKMMRTWKQAMLLQQVAPKGTAEGQGLARGSEDFLKEGAS